MRASTREGTMIGTEEDVVSVREMKETEDGVVSYQ